MAFFRNRAVNLLNLHSAIHSIANTGGGAFFTIFLLRSGVSPPGVFLSLALIMMGRFAIRPAIVGLAVRRGLRAMVIAGTILAALEFPFLAEVQGVGLALLALMAVCVVGEAAYWTSYHAYFASLGDDASRGQQVGAREAISAVVGIASPLATGWMLVAFGPRVAFGGIAAIAALAAVPLLWAPDVAVKRHAPGAYGSGLAGMLLFAADGWIAVGYVFVWQIALFISLGENLLAYGGAIALAALAGAIGGLTLGRHIDAGHGGRAVWYALGTVALIIMLRAAATGHAAVAVLANAAGAFGVCLYIPTLMTAVYTLAKRSPCALRFHVMTEGGWDAGGASGLLVVALATFLGMPLPGAILLSLAGVVVLFLALRRFYAGRLPLPCASIAPLCGPG